MLCGIQKSRPILSGATEAWLQIKQLAKMDKFQIEEKGKICAVFHRMLSTNGTVVYGEF